MTFVQATTGQGGWPLNVFLTPDRRPFFGGTYFPPEGRSGRPGFGQLLRQLEQIWSVRQEEVVRSAAEIHERLLGLAAQAGAKDCRLSSELLHQAARAFRQEYDPRHGGFGGAPKFPRPCQPAFLMRYGVRFADTEAVRMVLHTCERMAAGGIHDQLGGGFHRYSVDAEWLVPHFEKMLYDNAQLADLYLDAYCVSGEGRHAAVARDILRYVVRDLTHSEGGFSSAEDADSEGQEGKFYCWTRSELAGLLTPEEFAVVIRRFGITEGGNFVDHSHPAPLPGQNVLHLEDDRLSGADWEWLDSARAKMVAVRDQRVRPHRDDKVLSSWNGLMLGAFARAYAVLGDETCRTVAERNLAFLRGALWDEGRRCLHHRWREGERDEVQLLDAYAFLLAGVLDLYEATLDARNLGFAVELAEAMMVRFHDREGGGFFQSAATPDLILRFKEDYDGAEPAGNSVAVLALLKLAAMTGRMEFRQVAEATLRWLAERMERLPQAVPRLLLGLDFWLEEPRRVVIAGGTSDPAVRVLLRAAHSVYQPNKVVLGTEGPVEETAKALAGRGVMAQVCTGSACLAPTTDPAELVRQLR
jgi:uncharacterized protein YyaL (SSP411 family)